ncbi:MAG TPA: cytotoxic translational repressor of toxin-antitoxin stability system, partial [Sphaerochaeta sp.]|nr:cytotoxic translational repressor of toxin-antitoxin stability system [Sphaerochaeta sp.]
RVGSYRVLFNILETVEIISIEEVRKRDERTYSV